MPEDWEKYAAKPSNKVEVDDWSQYEVKKKPLPPVAKSGLPKLDTGLGFFQPSPTSIPSVLTESGATDYTEDVIKPFQEKKRALSDSLNFSKNAYKTVQGKKAFDEIQTYQANKPKDVLGDGSTQSFTESVVNTGNNIGNRLQGFVPRLKVASADVWTKVLGKELAGKWYGLEGRDLDEERRTAYLKLDQLAGEVKQTQGLLGNIQQFNAPALAAGVVDAMGSLVSTAIPTVLTAGGGLFTDMVGESIVNFNEAKAKSRGLSVEDLYKKGEAEFNVPASIGTLATGLELIGLKGVQQAISSQLKGSALRKAAIMFGDVNKEGLTELIQTGLDDANLTVANGGTAKDATNAAVKAMFSKKGLESYLKGVAGSGGAAGVGRLAKTAFRPEFKKEVQSLEEAQQSTLQDIGNPDLSPEAKDALMDIAVDNHIKIEKALSKDNKQFEALSNKQKEKVQSLNEESNKLETVLEDNSLSKESKVVVQKKLDTINEELSTIEPDKEAAEADKLVEEAEMVAQEKEAIVEPEIPQETELIPINNEQGINNTEITESTQPVQEPTQEEVINTEKVNETNGDSLTAEDDAALNELSKKSFLKQEMTGNEKARLIQLKNKKNEVKRTEALKNPLSKAYDTTEVGTGVVTKGVSYKGANIIASINDKNEVYIAEFNKETGKYDTIHYSEHATKEEALNEFNKQRKPIDDEINSYFDGKKAEVDSDPITTSKEEGTISEAPKATALKNEPKTSKVADLASNIPNNGEVKKYLSGDTIEKYEGEAPSNKQDYIKQELRPALEHGIKIIDAAKEEYGDNYVEKTLDFIESHPDNIASKALMYVSLENDLAARKLSEPDNELAIAKLQDLVRAKSQAYLRTNAIEINMGRLRKIAEAGYDINKVTENFFSTEQRESKNKIEKAIQSDSDAINKEAQEIEISKELDNELVDFDLEKAISEGVEKSVNDIYEKLGSKRREKADKAIAALDKIQKRLRSYSYDATIGIPVQIIDGGITTIKAAIKAGVNVADAIELGINKIKEKYGKAWLKEGKFRKDMLDGFTKEGVELKSGKRIMTPEQKRKMYVSRLVKDIADLDTQIEAQKRKVVTKDDKYKNDEEILALRDAKSDKQKELAVIDSSYADRLKLKNDLKSAKKSLDEYERRLNESNFNSKRDGGGNLNPQLKELREKRDKAKDIFNKSKREYEKSLVTEDQKAEYESESRIEQIKQSINNLKDKLNGIEPDDKVKSSLWTKEIGELENEREKIKNELNEKRKAERESIVPKERDPLTHEERLSNAKNNIKDRIEGIRSEILNKERELKSRSKPIQEDAELTRLKTEEATLKSLRDKYLPKEESGFKDAKIVDRNSKKLLGEIEDINRQIKNGEKDVRAAKKDPVNDLNLSKLKAEKSARLAILEEIDPNPKDFVKQALIEKGFGREITVTTKSGKEKRQIIDWRKLAGEEGSIAKMQANVEFVLKDKGYSDADIVRMQASFENEYNDLRASIIKKSLQELDSRNTPKDAPDYKTSARRLAELYNYGLFEKESDTYDYLLNKALGLSDIGQQSFFEAKKLAKALSDLYKTKDDGRSISEFGLRHAIRNLNTKIESLLSKVAWEQSNGAFKAVTLAKEYMGLAQRNMLTSVKQAIENPLSGAIQRTFSKIGFSFDNVDTKALNKNRSEIAKTIYEDSVRNGGLHYGDVTTPFVSKTRTEDWINKQSDSKLYHTIASGMLGRSYLEGADGMHKAALTEKYFTYNLIKVLTDKNNPKRMSKEDAIKYVSDNLTGQTLLEAKTTSKEIIKKANTEAGKVVIPDNKQSVDRLAEDIVKDSLVKGEKLTIEEIESSYEAAYRAAGFDLGHEANNPISLGLSNLTHKMENNIQRAIKEKKWNEAAAYTFASILSKNILNPFVGGGTNWVVLTMQKTGVDFVSPIYDYARKSSNKLDLTTDAGIKNIENSLLQNLKSKNTNSRFLIGAMASLLAYSALKSTGSDDDINKWLKKHEWARKYFNVVAPQILVFMLAAKNKQLGKYFGGLLNIKSRVFDDGEKMIDAINGISSNKSKKNKKGWGKVGQLVGSKLSAPLVPWRFIRDSHNIVRGINGKPQMKYDFNSIGFMEGYFQSGLVDYIKDINDKK